jgi:hypothetical protein
MRGSKPLLLSCFCVCLVVGCQEPAPPVVPPSSTEADLAKAAAADIYKSIGIPEPALEKPRVADEMLLILDNKQLSRVWPYIDSQFENRDVSGLAALVNVDGPWHKSPWYWYFAQCFAMRFGNPRPIQLRGAESAVRALKSLAAEDPNRSTRVCAAIALQFEDPDLARRVLKEEYGKFIVRYDMLDAIGSIYDVPPACGPTLRRLGVWAPEEITTVWRAEEMLRYRNINIDSEDEKQLDVLADAANRYNDLCRKAVVTQDSRLRWELEGWPSELDHFVQIWQDVRKNWKPSPPKGPALFGP